MISTVSADNAGVLDGILKPAMIKVFADEIFVVEGHKVFIYSLKDLSLKNKIGREGEGPGEYKLDPARTLIITVLPEYIIAESRHKVAFFSRQGKFIKEMKKSPFILQVLPFGDNYVVHKITSGKGDRGYFSLHIFDAGMNPVKELYRQKFFTFENKVFVMPDGLNYCICDNKLFVEESPEGFVIEVFDSKGNKLDRIEKQYEKIKVPEAEKETAYNDYTGIPFLRRMRKERGKQWVDNFLKSQNIVYPDYYYPIHDIASDGKKLYVRTYHKKNNKEKYLIMDTKGNILKEVYLPIAKKVDFLVQMQGDKKYYNIHNDKFYYLKLVEKGDDEDWQVFVEKIE
jgi:hypothetical protein